MARTTPNTFHCRDHGTDLTADVIAAIEDTGLTVISSGMRIRRNARPQPFTVDVQCPEDDGHIQVFHGTYRSDD